MTCLYFLVQLRNMRNDRPGYWIYMYRQKEFSLKLNSSKCQFFLSSVKCLGNVVSKDGVSTDHGKIGSVKSWPTPSNAWELKSF